MKFAAALAAAAALTACGPRGPESSSSSMGSQPAPGSSSSMGSSSSNSAPRPGESSVRWEDGIYRGAYLDSGENQVTVEFTLRDGKFQEVQYRSLDYRGVNYLAEGAAAPVKALAGQYRQLLDHLKGKGVSALEDLYRPASIAKDTDTSTAATLVSGKVISALRDGLNRGVYQKLDSGSAGGGSSSSSMGSSSAGSSSSMSSASSGK